MSAGTIRLTNGSTAAVGTGTVFTSDLKSGDVITATVGGIFFTLFVDAVTSNTALTLTDPFTGPTTSGLAWVAVPQLALNRITAALAAQTAESVRRVLQENANWQAFYSGTGDITVTLPDGSPAGRQVAGPSWAKMSGLVTSTVSWRGALPANANLNTYGPTASNVGQWGQNTSTSAQPANGFPEENAVGNLEVMPGGSFGCTQRYTVRSGNIYIRSLTASWNGVDGPWGPWLPAGYSPTGYFTGDMNTLTAPGSWSTSNTIANGPIPAGQATSPPGICKVEPRTSANTLVQTYTSVLSGSTTNKTWTRTLSGTTWSWWDPQGTGALNDLGLGRSAISTLSTFDWQQADFLSGAIYLVSSTNVTNMPAGLSFAANTGLYIRVSGTSSNGTRNSIEVIPDTVASSNYKVYEVLSVGAKGSRVFYPRQRFTDTDSIPVANGGTGATTAAAARTNLGLGSAATKNAGTASGELLAVGAAYGLGSNLDAYSYTKPTGFYTGQPDAPTTNYGGGCLRMSTATFQSEWFSPLAGPVRFFARNINASSGGSAWAEFYSTQNTTKAADGTLKAASPVVQIFHDGSLQTNDESEGCTVTRLSVGEYLVEGCIGLNSDAAWGGIDGGFDIPKDRNRQPLIWLDYNVNPDGSVLVKTYHRTHPGAPAFARNEIEGVAEGNPIDIPADQFVSVRVEMPIDSAWNQRQDEAARIQAEQEAERKLAEEEAARVKAEQDRLEEEAIAEVERLRAEHEAKSDEEPDVQQ